MRGVVEVSALVPPASGLAWDDRGSHNYFSDLAKYLQRGGRGSTVVTSHFAAHARETLLPVATVREKWLLGGGEIGFVKDD